MGDKKGGMVLIIGMGDKPKKEKKESMKKSVRAPRKRGGSGGSNRARLHSFRQKVMKDPQHLDRVLGSVGVERNLLEHIVERKHGKSLDSAMSDDSVNMPEMIDEARKVNAANKGQFTESGDAKPKLKQLLQRKGISVNEFKRSMKLNPTMDFQERLNSLSQGSSDGGSSDSKREERSDERFSYNDPRNQHMFDEYEGEEDKKQTSSRSDDDEDDHLLDFYTRLYSHKPNPEEAAMMHLRPQGIHTRKKYNRAGPDTTPSTVFTQRNVQPGFRAGSPDEDEDPSVGFSASSIGAETPKGDTANPRLFSDPSMDARQVGSTRTRTRDFQMSSDSTNVMDSAWALLKGNPDMLDAEGNTVPPAVMNYAQQARGLEDSLDYQNIKGRDKNKIIAPDMRDDENTSRFAEMLKDPKFAQLAHDGSDGAESMQGHHDFARESSKRDTSEYMDNEHDIGHEGGHFGPDPAIQRMPRPEDTPTFTNLSQPSNKGPTRRDMRGEDPFERQKK